MNEYGSKLRELVFSRGSWSHRHYRYTEFLSAAWEGKGQISAAVMDELLDHTASVRLPIIVGCATVRDWQPNLAVSSSIQQIEKDWKDIHPVREKYIEEEASPNKTFNSNASLRVVVTPQVSRKLLVRQQRPHLPVYGIGSTFWIDGAWDQDAYVYNLRSKWSISKCVVGELLRQTARTRKLLFDGAQSIEDIVEGDRAWVPLLAVRPACALLAEEFYVGRDPWVSPQDGGSTSRWYMPPGGWALRGHELRMPQESAPYNGCDENLFGWRSLTHNSRGTFDSVETMNPPTAVQKLMSSFEFPAYAVRSVGPPVLMDGVFVDLAKLVIARATAAGVHVPHTISYAADRLTGLLNEDSSALEVLKHPYIQEMRLLVDGVSRVLVDLYTPCADTVGKWLTEKMRDGMSSQSIRITGQEAPTPFVALEDHRTPKEIENLCMRMARVYVTLLHANSLPVGICNVYGVAAPGGWLRSVEYWPLAQHFIRDLQTLWSFLDLMDSTTDFRVTFKDIDHGVNMPTIDAVLQLLAWKRIESTLYDHQQTIDALVKVPIEIREETYNGINWCPS